MTLVETVRNIFIGLTIAILIPIISSVSVPFIFEEPESPHYLYGQEERQTEEYNQMYEKYREEKEIYDGVYSWFVFGFVGITFLILGLIVPIPFIGMGFILGGTFSFAIGIMPVAVVATGSILKLISLIAALVILIIGGLILNRNKNRT